MKDLLNKDMVRKLVEAALNEDIGKGDVTTDSILNDMQMAKAVVKVKNDAIICGIPVFEEVFNVIDKSITVIPQVEEGDFVKANTIAIMLEGHAKGILKGERTALNFLQRMSGIATKTAKMAALISDFKAKIIDTRKTTPCLRFLEKYAVKIGGGENHRFGLYDMFLIKDNHITAAGGIRNAIIKAKANNKDHLLIEVEAQNLDDVRIALEEGVDRILLDNMDPLMIKEAVKMVNGRIPLEASGGITANTIVPVASTGVDYISIGALTHSVEAIDISLKIIEMF